MKREQLFLLRIIEKEQKGLKLKVEGTLLGEIGILMNEKGTKTLCKELIEKEKNSGKV